ncbi:MAG: ribonuclease Y, partial [Nitrospinota bacterium]
KELSNAKKEAQAIVKEAQLEARELLLKANNDLERKMSARKKEIETVEARLLDRKKGLDKRLANLDKRSAELARKEQSGEDLKRNTESKYREAQNIVKKRLTQLEQVAKMSQDEARQSLQDSLLKEVRLSMSGEVQAMEREAKAQAQKEAGYIIATAAQRMASDYVAENTVNVVDIPNDDMKGRIIGREGRNIRSIEEVTGVDLIIDDTPNAIVISCFDPVRREIARESLTRLVNDGRINPVRVEQVVAKVTTEIDQIMLKDAQQAIFELELEGVHPELVKILGRLKYRTSHSQNVLRHSVEVGFLAGMMAVQLGQDQQLAKRAGLLHDLGKALDQTHDGTHTQIGIEVARRYNEDEVVINSIASHHEDAEATSIISILVAAADALSASRPGARREMLENYIARMRDLEKIGSEFDGVQNTFAIRAGREIRVIVEPTAISDAESFFLVKDITKKIESDLSYPGEIKVTVIRETRVSDYAK